MSKRRKLYTQNRELSWLKFNERVLEEAADPSVPLMERLKFVSIFTSNLDEFFMIRVGSLFDIYEVDGDCLDLKSGMTTYEQLRRIYDEVRSLYKRKTEVYAKIKEELTGYGVYSLNFSELAPTEVKYVKEYYKANIKPVLSPQIVDVHHPFPHISNKEIQIVTLLKQKGGNILGLLPIPKSVPETIYLPGTDLRYIRTERILLEFVEDIFQGYEILDKNCICVTRNADINPDDENFDLVDDFRVRMKQLLHKRKKLSVVRLEANFELSEKFSEYLCDKFKIKENQIFISDTAINMGYAFALPERLSTAQKSQLTYAPFKPVTTSALDLNESIMAQVQAKDVILSYPYESMDGFLKLIKEAANNEDVVSIKITIYRLAKKAKLVEYLCAAAENGKDVTVLMELKARFDEQNNIDWSERLEDAGCKVIYGFDMYKVHSKICLITKKEKNGFSYITQVGTGNYNEKTTELYTDLSLITANTSIGNDAVNFFKNMSIGNLDGKYDNLIVAPTSLKSTLLDLIDKEIEKGSDGFIFMKMNSLTDTTFIDKLAKASKAGVRINLIVRGISCLLPQIPKETENINIISVVGRYLEHSRVYSFGTGVDQKMYIASADLMTRNTEKRVEVGCPVYSDELKAQINEHLKTLWFDNVKSRILCNDGTYVKKVDNLVPCDAQATFMKMAEEKNKNRPVRVAKKKSAFKEFMRKVLDL